MASGGKWFSIIIAPHDRADSWKLKVPGWVLWGFLGFCVLGIASLVGFGFLFKEYQAQADLVDCLKIERGQLVEAKGKIALLEEELSALWDLHGRVRKWVGLPPDTSLLRAEREAYAAVSDVRTRLLRIGGGTAGEEWAWPAKGWISQGFHPGSGKDSGHFGVDVVAGKDEPVRASRAGRVTFCGWDDRFGNLIVIEHEGGYESRYGHNADLLVSEGESVSKGQEIAIIGSTGVSSAPHLHFEIRKDGVPVDPMGVLTGH